MARGINKVILVGNLGNDPDMKSTQGGTSVANISVATTEAWKDRDGQQQERTEWHRVVCFGKLAEIVGEYLHKGAQVYIEGKLQTDKWTDKDGIDRYTTKVIADEMRMLGGRQDNGSGSQDRPRTPARDSAGSASRPPSQPAAIPDDVPFDDDIPF